MADINDSGWVNWIRESKRKKLTQTLEITFDMFNKGNTIEEIATKREMKVESIERQIIELIAMGFFHIEDVLPMDKIQTINRVIEENDTASLSKLKEILGDDYSYYEIKSVLAFLSLIPKKRS